MKVRNSLVDVSYLKVIKLLRKDLADRNAFSFVKSHWIAVIGCL